MTRLCTPFISAHVSRGSAKSASDWTQNELTAYNITVVYEDAPTFFQMPNLPPPTVNPEALTARDPNDTDNAQIYVLLRALDLAMSPAPTEESAVDDFVVQLFFALGYLRIGRVVRTRKDIPLIICGENRHAKTDVCILDDNDILLLVQEDKRHMENADPEPQLVAEAIAAFALNNQTRLYLGLPPIQAKVMAGITMKGTAPIFYKIPVTTDLVTSVQGGTYPNTPIVIHAHIPNIPRPARRWSEGMKPLDNRRVILSCFEAFKQFVN